MLGTTCLGAHYTGCEPYTQTYQGLTRMINELHLHESTTLYNRGVETMLDELDIAGWTAVQGNRSSINAETVDSSMIGGSIKKGQIGHFIVSIAKSLDQKESGRANMAILKSRFGKDGIIFEDIIFDNGRVFIDMSEGAEQGKTFLQTEEHKQTKDLDRVKMLREAMLKRVDVNNSSSGTTSGEIENNNN